LDLALDWERASKLDCSNCDRALQKARNCSGKGSPGKVELNGKFYPRCPRAISLESFTERYIVKVYFECRETDTYPFPGPWGAQTAFCGEVFDYLDAEVNKKKAKDYQKQKAELDKRSQQNR
jgi:hypothetical protein